MILTKLAKELDNLNKHSDGELILRNEHNLWHFYLVRSQLLYATGGIHPVRRWERALKQHRPNWNWRSESFHLSGDRAWECQLLDRGFSEKHLSLIQAKFVIRSVVQECLFELSNCYDFTSEWKQHHNTLSTFSRVVALSANEIQSVIGAAQQLQSEWKSAGLSKLNPNLSPVLLEDGHSQLLTILPQYLNGKSTLWDIASHLEKSIVQVTSSLTPLVSKGILKFEEIPDLLGPKSQESPPITHSPIQPIPSNQKQPLIACIDDSPVLAHTLRKILIPAGYKMLSIPEPMRGFGQLIEDKPDLILLDLLLPNADGYSICKFLRDTSVFKDTPIIILTARNTQIDRVRAKLVGATEFLGKPPQSEELLQIVRKYLSK
ncbi:MAG TPA: response regulator [Cyanobacteria bacterium UBA11149]|nr:response regulator [Cyanobacteria bacterium UBA11367]HBE56105.1 response regulator [Cyanobacteria bacterium UBA11366]HBK65840.1 response regulator [Cyanobacteria bacterium UBA11166]HBR75150.1 response regulator [Cyanobacteria bacterium UBA11159]HBS70105.1 response regulator [Cyanobacteria bacterium UBA11153]HBW90723.1 response regulator [Cyanobacteria bacterium UBA11149]HCA93443.1 response regulator [Cyanobacteria bacterium UBA9226]